MSNSKKLDQNELIDLGKKLQDFYNQGYVNKKQAILFSFYKGIAAGAGAFIGGTIVIALLLWILSLFSQVPLLTHFVNNIQHLLTKQNVTK